MDYPAGRQSPCRLIDGRSFALRFPTADLSFERSDQIQGVLDCFGRFGLTAGLGPDREVKGGLGVMLDDLVAGLVVGSVLYLSIWGLAMAGFDPLGR